MKIIIVTNCTWKSWNAKIEAIKAWFSPAIDLEIEIVNKTFTSIPWEKSINSDGVKIDRIKLDWFKKNITSPKHDVTILTLDQSDWNGGFMDGYQNEAGIAIGCKEKGKYNFQGKKYPGDEWFNVARHEVAHAIYKSQGKYDMTHTYWKAGNIEQVLVDLKLPKTLVVTLTRDTYDKKQTLGSLNVGNFRCKTLERPWLNNQKNVSCIPEGEYKVTWTFSPKFMKYTYEVQSVPNRSAIRIHKGNFFYDIQGCILLGTGYSDINKDGSVDIINSTKTVQDFDTLMGGKDFTLRII